MLLDDETIFAAFKIVRDQVVFTNHRVIAVNVEGVTGKQKDYTSLDTLMDLWFKRMGIVTFQFSGRFDIAAFRLIGHHILRAHASN